MIRCAIILLPIVALMASGCGTMTGPDSPVFDTITVTNYVERTVQVPAVVTNYVESSFFTDVLDENGKFLGTEKRSEYVPKVQTNIITKAIQVPIVYDQLKLSEETSGMTKTIGGFFGPIGEGVAGIILLGLSSVAAYTNKRKEQEAKAKAGVERANATLINNIEAAKEVIKLLDPDQLDEFLQKIKRAQTQDQTRDLIRKALEKVK